VGGGDDGLGFLEAGAEDMVPKIFERGIRVDE